MTYLEIVNTVLIRLREEPVGSVNSGSYTRLIGSLVNAAKAEVEGTWRWHDMRTNVQHTTIPGTKSYALPAGSQVLGVYDSDTDLPLPLSYARTATGIDLVPTPQVAFPFYARVYAKQARLAADTDVLLCPVDPVIELTVAKALAERGEDGGTGGSQQMSAALLVLGNAAAEDMNRDAAEITWTVAE